MIIEFLEARKLAEDYLAVMASKPGGVKYLIVTDRVFESNDGWYFPYQSEKYLLTGDFNYSVVGNWPIFVRHDGGYIGGRRPDAILSNVKS